MAGPLAAVERFFERLFERPAARLFQARVEVVQIQRAVERVMEAERQVHARRSYVPSTYRVLLSEPDLAALDGDVSVLASKLAESLRAYARGHGYTLLAHPRVEIGSSPAVAPSDIRAFAEPVVVPADPPRRRGSAAQAPRAASPEELEPGLSTSVFAAPKAGAPRAQLVVRCPGQPVARCTLRPGTTRIGRAADNEVILEDDRVSRHHGQLSVRLGMLVYTDLGSTNGSFLNGSTVSEIALGPGDVLQLGSSTVTIEPNA